MKIVIDPHTLERLEERGASMEEIENTILTGTPEPAKEGRKAKSKVFNFGTQRAGKFYTEKKIKVVYVEEETEIVTVTVIVFYGKWN